MDIENIRKEIGEQVFYYPDGTIIGEWDGDFLEHLNKQKKDIQKHKNK